MGNIDFSKVGRAILENKVLADYISRGLANVTPEENAAGKIKQILPVLAGTQEFGFRMRIQCNIIILVVEGSDQEIMLSIKNLSTLKSLFWASLAFNLLE